MRRSITSNYDDTTMMLFREAVRITLRELKQQGKDADILLSHALSSYDDDEGSWSVSDICGTPVAVVNSAGHAILIEDMEEVL